MRKIFTLLAITVLLVSSCKKDQAKDAADDYLGNYSSTTSGWGDFGITKVDANSILLKENVTNGWTAIAKVNGNTLDIAKQLIDGYYTWGTGVRSGNKISFAVQESQSSDATAGHAYGFDLVKK
jgi:hypothetical protein